MSGEQKLKQQLEDADNNTEKMLEAMKVAMEEYKRNLKMDSVEEFDDDVGSWLNADAKMLSMIDAQTCAEVAHMMLRYHMFLMSHLSHEKVQLKTLNVLIYQWASPHWESVDFMGVDMKVYAIARRYNQALKTPLSLKRYVEARIQTIEGMAAAAKDQYHFFMNYARMKNAG